MDGRSRTAGYKTWLALIAVAAIAWICAAATQQTVNIQLIAYVRPNTVVGTTFFYDGAAQIASAPSHGGLVRVVVPLTLGVHQLQAVTVGTWPYGSSSSEIETYTVDPAKPLVMFGLR